MVVVPQYAAQITIPIIAPTLKRLIDFIIFLFPLNYLMSNETGYNLTFKVYENFEDALFQYAFTWK
ncbi:hypothetical protein CAL7716_040660 [Calothrix sp. PCC 7716]|nr:hypothetical protein CAL7716_040660 [Calothrix sp. PCC 7716]